MPLVKSLLLKNLANGAMGMSLIATPPGTLMIGAYADREFREALCAVSEQVQFLTKKVDRPAKASWPKGHTTYEMICTPGDPMGQSA